MDESSPGQEPAAIGHDLLIAMSNTPASLAMVTYVAQRLPDPPQTRVTLMHYLQPMVWEHGGDSEAQRELRHMMIAEEQAMENERSTEQRTQHHFDQASDVLQKAGMPASNIQAKLRWDDQDVAMAIQNELRAGRYTTVIVGQHHHDFLSRLLGLSLTALLQNQAQRANVWVIQDLGTQLV